MYAIYIESSHERGMGHLFRAMNIYLFLSSKNIDSVILVNSDPNSENELSERGINYLVVNSVNEVIDSVKRKNIDICIIDRFKSDNSLCESLSKLGVFLVGIDDCGEGAAFFDLHFCGLLFGEPKGKRVYKGKEYIILNPDIALYRHKRTKMNRLLVTLGGTDTYGVTLSVVEILMNEGISADVIVGPGFEHREELYGILRTSDSNARLIRVFDSVYSLIKKMTEYDLAITGGGVTCIEANASGLPCIIIANERHEIDIANYVSSFGGALFAGYYKKMNIELLHHIEELDIERMSIAALSAFDLDGMENIYRIIEETRQG